MDWLTAELVQALGVAVATVIAAVTAWQARQVKQLRERVEILEQQMEKEHARFRTCVRIIRSLLRHIEDLGAFIRRRIGEDPPANPVTIPPDLDEEI
uniref:hypothetical protein n=1 Tax=Nocardia suismassiliense TaxID=2077092 RepID=UPI003F498B56